MNEYADLMIETSNGARPEAVVKRVLQGRGMVEPVRQIVVTYDGARETLRPGRDRLALNHEIVTGQPAAFRPVDATDGVTRERLRSMQRPGTTATRSRERELYGATRTPGRRRKTSRLPLSRGPSAQTWRVR